MEPRAANPLTTAAGRNESLHRAFTLLQLLSKNQDGASVAALAASSGLPRSTVSRMLASLFDVGAVARPGPDRLWVLGPAISQLSGAIQSDVSLQVVGRSVLENLSTQLKETCMMAVPIAETMATVTEEVHGTHLLGIAGSWKSQSVSSLESGFVRILVAELPEARATKIIRTQFEGTEEAESELLESIRQIRSQDYSVVVDTLEPGLAGLGIPVRREGKLVAMLATYLPTTRFTEAFEQEALLALREGAAIVANRS